MPMYTENNKAHASGVDSLGKDDLAGRAWCMAAHDLGLRGIVRGEPGTKRQFTVEHPMSGLPASPLKVMLQVVKNGGGKVRADS